MTPKNVQTLARLLAVVALLILAVRWAKAAPPQEYIDSLLHPPTPIALRLLPVYPVAATPVAKPAVKPVVKSTPATVKPVIKRVLTRAQQDENGAKTVAFLRSIMWWRETQGYNRGPGINEAIRENGGTQGEEYCGDTQAKAQRSCGLYVPRASNGSYNWFLIGNGRNVLLGNVGTFDSARLGYKVGIFNRSRGRIAHITAIAEPPIIKRNSNAPARGGWCIAGNEGRGTNAGVHRTWYPAANMYGIANYNK